MSQVVVFDMMQIFQGINNHTWLTNNAHALISLPCCSWLCSLLGRFAGCLNIPDDTGEYYLSSHLDLQHWRRHWLSSVNHVLSFVLIFSHINHKLKLSPYPICRALCMTSMTSFASSHPTDFCTCHMKHLISYFHKQWTFFRHGMTSLRSSIVSRRSRRHMRWLNALICWTSQSVCHSLVFHLVVYKKWTHCRRFGSCGECIQWVGGKGGKLDHCTAAWLACDWRCDHI